MAQSRRVVYDSEDSEDDFKAVEPVFCPFSPPVPAAAAELPLPAATPTPLTDVSVSDNEDGLLDPWAVPCSPPRAIVPAKPKELPRKKGSGPDSGTGKKRKRVATDGRIPERTSTTSHILDIALPMDSVSAKKQQQPAQEHEDYDELAPSATTPLRQKRPALQLLSSPDVIAEPTVRKVLPRPPPVPPPAARETEGAVDEGKDGEALAKQTKRKRTPKSPHECGYLAEDDELLRDQEEKGGRKYPVAHMAEPVPEKIVAAEPPARAPADNSGHTKAKPNRPRGRPKKKKETEATTGATDTTTAALLEAIHETVVPPVVPRKESKQSTVPAAAETTPVATNGGSDGRREAPGTDANPRETEHQAAPLAENKPLLPAAPPPRPASLKLSSTAQGRVPFRVGLSRTTRIAPLLKSLKK